MQFVLAPSLYDTPPKTLMLTKKTYDNEFFVRKALHQFDPNRFVDNYTIQLICTCKLDDSNWKAVQEAIANQQILPNFNDVDINHDILEIYLLEQPDGNKLLVAINDPFEFLQDKFVLKIWLWYEGCCIN